MKSYGVDYDMIKKLPRLRAELGRRATNGLPITLNVVRVDISEDRVYLWFITPSHPADTRIVDDLYKDIFLLTNTKQKTEL